MQTETTATTTATPEGAAATTAATTPATSTATAATPASDSTQTTTPSTTATAAEGDGKPAGEAKPATGAPEKYEPFKLADGALSAEELAGVETAARGLGLSQEGAQKLAEMRAADKAGFAQAQQQAVADARASWVAEVKGDKDIGGDKLPESLGIAKAGLKAIDPDGVLTGLLESTGMGDHPAVIKALHRAGKALAPDSIVPGGKAPNGPADARRLYGASNMNP